jgi:predicted transcriptional regulator
MKNNKQALDTEQLEINQKVLNLAIAQIQASLWESNSKVESLSEELMAIMTEVEQLKNTIKNDSLNNEVNELCESITSSVQSTIIDFQFYDRLRQRLEHVSESLTDLAEQPTVELLQQAKQRYTMPDENEILDMIIAGMTVKQISLHQAQSAEQPEDQQDDVELF